MDLAEDGPTGPAGRLPIAAHTRAAAVLETLVAEGLVCRELPRQASAEARWAAVAGQRPCRAAEAATAAVLGAVVAVG